MRKYRPRQFPRGTLARIAKALAVHPNTVSAQIVAERDGKCISHRIRKALDVERQKARS